MEKYQRSFAFSQTHIDVARNSTDDFNLFHDQTNWHQIQHNPFGGPIAMGFQMSCVIEDSMREFRQTHQELDVLEQMQLDFSHYQLNFVSVVKADEHLTLDIKSSRVKQQQAIISNRLLIKGQQGMVLSGSKIESSTPQFGQPFDLIEPGTMQSLPDRSFIHNTEYFYKRKFTANSDAKNFLTGSAVQQSTYFDEVNSKICFPETYCTALISCALLEAATAKHLDFKINPMVYTSHKLAVHRKRVAALSSNQALHFVVDAEQLTPDQNQPINQACWVFNQECELLVQGEIMLAPLSYIIGNPR